MPRYADIVERSFQVAWKYKWLWVFASLAGIGSGAGSGNSGGQMSSFFEKSESDNQAISSFFSNLTQSPQESFSQVLSSTTASVESLFTSITALHWTFLGITLFLAFIIATIVGFVAQRFALGAIIQGTDQALTGNEQRIPELSRSGIKNLKVMVNLAIVQGVIGILTFFVPIIIWLIGYIMVRDTILFGFWVVIGVLAFFIMLFFVFIVFGITGVYAERLVVLKGMKAKESWLVAFRIARKKIWPSVIMGIINMTLGCISTLIIGLITIVPIAISIWQAVSGKSVVWGIMGAFLGLIAILGFTVLKAYLYTLNTANWNQLFAEFMKGDNGN